jgi:hypothetical protein
VFSTTGSRNCCSWLGKASQMPMAIWTSGTQFSSRSFNAASRAAVAMPTFGLTVLAAATFWSIVYLLLVVFVGGHPNFSGQNIVEFIVNASLLLMLGWLFAGVAYAVTRFKLTEKAAFTTCVVTMAVFAYAVGTGTYNKVIEPQKRFDRVICKTNPKTPGC